MRGQKETSRGDKKNFLESAKRTTNKTNINNTESNETEPNIKEGEGDSAWQNKKQNEENMKQENIRQAIKDEIERPLNYLILQMKYLHEAK